MHLDTFSIVLSIFLVKWRWIFLFLGTTRMLSKKLSYSWIPIDVGLGGKELLRETSAIICIILEPIVVARSTVVQIVTNMIVWKHERKKRKVWKKLLPTVTIRNTNAVNYLRNQAAFKKPVLREHDKLKANAVIFQVLISATKKIKRKCPHPGFVPFAIN